MGVWRSSDEGAEADERDMGQSWEPRELDEGYEEEQNEEDAWWKEEEQYGREKGGSEMGESNEGIKGMEE